MDQKRYDEVKNKAATIRPITQMGLAMNKMGKQQEALKYLKDAYDKAVEVVEEYGELGAAYVVYASASGPLFRQYSESGMAVEALGICAADIRHFRPIHGQTHTEKPCSLLLVTAQQTTIAFFEFMNSPAGQQQFDSQMDLCRSIIQQIFNFLFLTTKAMESIDPENLTLKGALMLVKKLQQMGFQPESDKTVANMGEIMDCLARELGKMTQ